MKDSKNLLLLLVCIALLVTWVYHLYDKSQYSHHQFEVLVKDTLATQETIKDSLQRLFNQKTVELDTTKIVEDSLKGTLDSTMLKIYDLRIKITNILRNRNATNMDLKKAKDLITEYQEKIEEMKAQNNDLEAERTRLNGILAQLNDQMKNLQENNQKITDENKELTETINEASTFIASELCLSAVTVRPGKKETEAFSAKKANKFIFSFALQNNIVQSTSYDVYVVITQPDNKVLQNDIWGAGADHFTSKTEGTKAYTAKIHFEYNKGEKKKLLYTVQPDNFLSGTYTFQVYQNGVALGETTKQLN
jgi:predicted  nucleic acid-binding Zn-ribbon protein